MVRGGRVARGGSCCRGHICSGIPFLSLFMGQQRRGFSDFQHRNVGEGRPVSAVAQERQAGDKGLGLVS